MRVLVTGGAGYIGSHAAKALYHAGHVPVVVDSLVRGNRQLVKWGPFVQGDIGDRGLLREVMTTHKVDALMHFAAFAYVGESMTAPARYFHNNTYKAGALLETAAVCGVKTIVFSSTCAVYGEPRVLPITEDHPLAPVNPYGESKEMTERVLKWLGRIENMQWVSLRYFNAAGADAEGETGELHDPETHLIPLAIEASTAQGRPLQLFGDDYETPDGTAVRDYVHVTDLANAHVRALEYLGEGKPSAAFNLGTGRGHSVREVLEAVSNVAGRKPSFEMRPRRAGDPGILIAGCSKAREKLGWEPKHSDLDNIIATAWNWMQHSDQHTASPAAHPAVTGKGSPGAV